MIIATQEEVCNWIELYTHLKNKYNIPKDIQLNHTEIIKSKNPSSNLIHTSIMKLRIYGFLKQNETEEDNEIRNLLTYKSAINLNRNYVSDCR